MHCGASTSKNIMTVNKCRSLVAAILVALCSHYAAGLRCYSTFEQQEYHFCALLAPNYALHWKVDSHNVTYGIDLELPAEDAAGGMQLGWVGFGLSEAGGMQGADIFVVRKNCIGAWGVEDRYGIGYFQPLLDNLQDVTLLTVPNITANGTRLQVVVTRRLDTCHSQDVAVELGIRQPIIYAYGDIFGYHGPMHRGEGVLTLWPLPAAVNATNATTSNSTFTDLTLNITMPGVPVPLSGDLYLCINVELPSDQTYHVTEYEGLLQSNGTSNHVHHMVLYSCAAKPSTMNTVYECPGMPLECVEFTVVWTPGAGSVDFPPEAGLRIGPTGTLYAALQIHYNNVVGEKDVIDSSGLTLRYTPQLRSHDMGVLVLGNVLFQVPPHVQDYTTGPSVCPAACTQRFSGNITVFAAAPHMHLTGAHVETQHIRGPDELRPFGVRNFYNFSYQPALGVPLDTSELIPGDALITTCYYNNPSNNTIKFGEKTSNEMCFSFLQVYPKSALNNIDACATIGNYNNTLIGGQAGCLSASDFVSMLLPPPGASTQSQVLQLLIQGKIVDAKVPKYVPFNATEHCGGQ